MDGCRFGYGHTVGVVLAVVCAFGMGVSSSRAAEPDAGDGEWPSFSVEPFRGPGAAGGRASPVEESGKEEKTGEAEASCEDEGPPLPLHTIEGMGGAFSVPSASLVNPAPAGEVFGKPSFGYIHVQLGHGKHLEVLSVTETLWDRIELGYAMDYLDVGDFYEQVNAAFGVRPEGNSVTLHNFNARVAIVHGDGPGEGWLPALTAGVHFKLNETIDDVDEDLGGGVEAIGIEDDSGWDFTLFASKMFMVGRPLVATVGLRSTEAAHVGLLGFTGDRRLLVEGSLCYLATDAITLAAEYRRKTSDYDEVPGLIAEEDDWWTLDACYLVDTHTSIAVGYGHFGHLLNHTSNRSYGVAVKYEF
ncbi:MAG: DUF3034 family protein [Planctomycetota bacterium]